MCQFHKHQNLARMCTCNDIIWATGKARNGKWERETVQETKHVDHVSYRAQGLCLCTSTNAMGICHHRSVCCIKEAVNWKLAALDEIPRCSH